MLNKQSVNFTPSQPNQTYIYIYNKVSCIYCKFRLKHKRSMGDYGWSMDFDTSQDIVAVEDGRLLEYPIGLWVTMGDYG